MRFVALACLVGPALSGPTPGAKWPFPYNWTRFPAAWFGANETNWESDAQIAEIGRYSMAILGWQHLDTPSQWTAVVYPQLTQAGIIKDSHPDLPVFVYTGFGWAMGINAAVDAIWHDPAYKDFFLQSTGDTMEFTQTDCQQGHVSPGSTGGRCVGWFWNFANASARDYYIEHLVTPLALSPTIDGVFYDAFNYGYDIPETRPWGKPVTNVPNCSNIGGAGWSGCDALVEGSIEIGVRIAEVLNAHGKVPMFANPGSFVKPEGRNIWLDEKRLVDALKGAAWFTYYESARAESALKTGNLLNMLEEAKMGVAAAVHTYYQTATEDPTPHMAAFLLTRQENWYYFGSTGWWDDSFTWSDLYDKATACGMPKGPAVSKGQVYSRGYTHCSATLDCSNATNCIGTVNWAADDVQTTTPAPIKGAEDRHLHPLP